MSTEFKDTLAHTQLGGNAEKLGGWDNAMTTANAIESGDVQTVREAVKDYSQCHELVERIITVSAKHR